MKEKKTQTVEQDSRIRTRLFTHDAQATGRTIKPQKKRKNQFNYQLLDRKNHSAKLSIIENYYWLRDWTAQVVLRSLAVL